MKATSIIACTLALSLLPVVHGSSAEAADSTETGIHRCDADDGSAIYTDKNCKQFDAQPTPLSDELVMRMTMADAMPSSLSASMTYRDASEPLPGPSPTRRALADGCARTPHQLSRDLLGSFAQGDVNRVAESYLWSGMTHRQALPVMKQLERLAAKPLMEARFLSAWIGSGDTSATQIPHDAGMMQLVFAGDGMHVIDVEVRRYSGCYFISF